MVKDTKDKKVYNFRTDPDIWAEILQVVTERKQEDYSYSVNQFINESVATTLAKVINKKEGGK